MTETQTSLSPGGRTTIRVVIVVAAALLCLGTVGGLAAAALGLGSTRVVADSRPLPDDVRFLEVDAGELPMAIRITADPDASAPSAELRLVSSAGTARHTIEVSRVERGARLAISGAAPEWMPWARAGELNVVLPPGFARGLTLHTAQKFGVVMVDADLDRLVAHNDNGAVLLRGGARSIEVHNQQGTIHSRRALAVQESFSATSIDGDITVDFSEPVPARIEAGTNGGQITIGLAGDGPFLVNASTASPHGNTVVRVPQAFDPQSAASVITARSASGNVTVDTRD